MNFIIDFLLGVKVTVVVNEGGLWSKDDVC